MNTLPPMPSAPAARALSALMEAAADTAVPHAVVVSTARGVMHAYAWRTAPAPFNAMSADILDALHFASSPAAASVWNGALTAARRLAGMADMIDRERDRENREYRAWVDAGSPEAPVTLPYCDGCEDDHVSTVSADGTVCAYRGEQVAL